jgi:S-adenosylmethionine/arginine decarboxylase-like enzyme
MSDKLTNLENTTLTNCQIFQFWGQHLMLDCKGGNESTRTKYDINEFVRELVPAIKMEAHGDPLIEHFGEGRLAGHTLVQLIKTSNICCHFCDDSGDFYLDIFSCKRFSVKTVKDLVIKWFKPKLIKETCLDRGV